MVIQNDTEWSEQIAKSHTLPKQLLVFITDTLSNLGQIIFSMKWKKTAKAPTAKKRWAINFLSYIFQYLEQSTTCLTGHMDTKLWYIYTKRGISKTSILH